MQAIKTVPMPHHLFKSPQKRQKSPRPTSISFSYKTYTFLAPNNPKLTEQSFSPMTGVGSAMISHRRSG